MVGQRLRQNYKKLHKDRHAGLIKSAIHSTLIRDEQTGFIHHPSGFPIEYKKIWFGFKEDELTRGSDIGLIFESEKYIRPGSSIEVTIPLRNELEKFRGKVVLVKNTGDYFEIGMWLQHQADASRARIVEQICHIESYLKNKKFKEGPYIINRERVAEEWISKYASSVPSL